nr:hypothetical protein CFP56_25630 [Quercus suber]
MWLQGKGKLRKEDQQYGDWLRADMVRHTRRSIAVISGASRSQTPWWRKQFATTLESDENLVEVDSLNVRKSLKHAMGCFGQYHDSNGQWSMDQIKKKEHA